MNEQQILARRRSAGFAAFFFSGVCAISSGVVVSLLQEQYGFAYGVTGTLLSLMNIGNLVAGFLSGVLPGMLGGMKRSVLLLSLGYLAGYGLMGFTGAVALLGLGFFLVGAAKGQVINTCTVLVGDSSPDRTRGMNIMHSCYACGALLCPFVIAAAGRAGAKAPLFLLALLGAALWLAFALTPMEQGGRKGGGRIDWSFLRSVRFWLLMGLIFCQNAAETSVTGWMVTYFKDSGIIAGALSTYTVTVMWGATLVARLLIAFVFPFKNPRKAMVVMGAGCIVTYFGPDAGPQPGGGHPAAVPLRLFDGRDEPHRGGGRRPDDHRHQHRHPAAGGQPGGHRHALGHRAGGRDRRPDRRHGLQHRALCGDAGVCGPGGPPARGRGGLGHGSALRALNTHPQ